MSGLCKKLPATEGTPILAWRHAWSTSFETGERALGGAAAALDFPGRSGHRAGADLRRFAVPDLRALGARWISAAARRPAHDPGIERQAARRERASVARGGSAELGHAGH